VVAQPQGNGLPILLVEDEAFLLPLLQRGLERAGYVVTAVSDAESAASRFHAGPRPAVLIADVTLPGRSGADLAVDLLRADEQLVCVLTSGFPVDPAVFPASLRPRIQVLQKPFLMDNLLEFIARFGSAQAGV
jgi:DNA-binding NtrC family response regulator